MPLPMPGPFLLLVFFCGWAFCIQDPKGTEVRGDGEQPSHPLSAQDCGHGAGETQGLQGPRAEASTLAILGPGVRQGSPSVPLACAPCIVYAI